MRKYRIMEQRLNDDIQKMKENVKELEIEAKTIVENNEQFIDLIKNYSLEQIIAMNRK